MTRVLPLVIAVACVAAACEAPMREVYALESETSLPEGLAFDPGSDTFFATAVRGGTITRVTPLGQELTFYRAEDPGVSLLGAHVDGGLVWVCEVDLRTFAAPRSRVLGLRIEDGAQVQAIALPGPAYCNDLTSDDAGAVYVTDSLQPRIFRVAAGEATVFAADPRFAGSSGGLGLTGIDVAPDGESLLVARMSPAGLFRVGLADAAVVEVEFFGDAFGVPGDPRFPGPDGLAFVGDELYVAFDGGVQQLRFPVKTRAEVRTSTAVPSGLSSVTDAGGHLYAIDSDAYRALYGGQQADPPFLILRVDAELFDGP